MTPRPRSLGLALGVAALLALPLAATVFGDGPGWGPGDFLLAALLLGGTGLAWELWARRGASPAYRAAATLALATALGSAWITLAVGVFGEPDGSVNAPLLGVPVVAVLGALLARFRARSLARVAVATALAQAGAALLALGAAKNAATPVDPVKGLVLSAIFCTLWLAVAVLFGKAARAVRSG